MNKKSIQKIISLILFALGVLFIGNVPAILTFTLDPNAAIRIGLGKHTTGDDVDRAAAEIAAAVRAVSESLQGVSR